MAQREAKLSVGQIYRYFASKDAIIAEMIRRIIDYRIAEMDGKRRRTKFRGCSPGDRPWMKMMTR